MGSADDERLNVFQEAKEQIRATTGHPDFEIDDDALDGFFEDRYLFSEKDSKWYDVSNVKHPVEIDTEIVVGGIVEGYISAHELVEGRDQMVRADEEKLQVFQRAKGRIEKAFEHLDTGVDVNEFDSLCNGKYEYREKEDKWYDLRDVEREIGRDGVVHNLCDSYVSKHGLGEKVSGELPGWPDVNNKSPGSNEDDILGADSGKEESKMEESNMKAKNPTSGVKHGAVKTPAGKPPVGGTPTNKRNDSDGWKGLFWLALIGSLATNVYLLTRDTPSADNGESVEVTEQVVQVGDAGMSVGDLKDRYASATGRIGTLEQQLGGMKGKRDEWKGKYDALKPKYDRAVADTSGAAGGDSSKAAQLEAINGVLRESLKKERAYAATLKRRLNLTPPGRHPWYDRIKKSLEEGDRRELCNVTNSYLHLVNMEEGLITKSAANLFDAMCSGFKGEKGYEDTKRSFVPEAIAIYGTGEVGDRKWSQFRIKTCSEVDGLK